MSDYSVVICYFRAGEKIRATLQALLAQSVLPVEIIVVDNFSQDGVLAALLAEPQFREVRLLSSTENRGYAGGMNDGIRALKREASHVLTMTHEVLLEPSAMEEMLTVESEEIAVLGPLLRRIGTDEVWSAGGFLDPRGRTGHLHTPPTEDGRSYEVDWLDGAVLLLNRIQLEAVQGLDEQYFMYWEDVDLCRRLQPFGRVVCVPSAVASQDTGLTPPYFASRNRILFWRRHGSKSAVAQSVLAELHGAVRELLHRHPRVRDAAARILGVVDGIMGSLHVRYGSLRSAAR